MNHLYCAYEKEIPLMTELGLKLTDYGREWTDLGTVILHEAGEYNPHPTTIKVEVSALPAKFWRFTITKNSDEVDPVPETIMVSTGSGLFTEYWPSVKQIAEHCLVVEYQ